MGYMCVILALCACIVFAQEKECEWPKCYHNDLHIFNAYGMNFTCTGMQKCNKYKKKDVKGKCDMCLDKICEDKFECTNVLEEVTINKKVYTCPKHYECNIDEIKNCVPCVKQLCPDIIRDIWTCSKNLRTVTVGNILRRCKVGTLCNKDYEVPCLPCIAKS